MLKVFKFGGASVRDAGAVRNVEKILRRFTGDELVVVVSAMGKTTNALENLAGAWYYPSANGSRNGNVLEILENIRNYHASILQGLFPDVNHPVYGEVKNLFIEIEWAIEERPSGEYDFHYDQIVSFGELISTRIISAFLSSSGILNRWVDARDFLKTDSTWRDARVNWEESSKRIREVLLNDESNKLSHRISLTQGFIGSTPENYNTTLGREGSDYTAAIIANLLDASEVVIWKDVPGVLNADPKYFHEVQKLENISYHEAIELSFFGATVIHPKTIKPLQNKNIPLKVKSFYHPDGPGTLIAGEDGISIEKVTTGKLIPSYIFKQDQILLTISPKDFSFIVEEHLSDIFGHLARYNIKVNLMEHSAICLSLCVTSSREKLLHLIEELRQEYKVFFNENLSLLTIRHYDDETVKQLTADRKILAEQRTRHTARYVMEGGFDGQLS